MKRLAAGALGLLFSWPSAVLALPNPKKEWIELKTANFQLISEAGETKTAEIGLSLERFRRLLARLKPGLTLESPVPTRIVAFESDRSFRPYKDRRIESREDMLGFFLSHGHGNFIALNAFPSQASPLAVIYHEYVHFFVRHNFPFLPLWANEGLAEFYSTFDQTGDQVQIGLPVVVHTRLLKSRSFIPLIELFAIDEASPEYNERDRQSLFYAESWVLMHYLLTEQVGRPGAVTQFLRALSDGQPPEQATRAVLGFSLAELETRLRAYVNVGRYAVTRLDLPEVEVPRRYQSRRMSTSEMYFHLGNLLAHGAGEDQRVEAEEHFRACLELDAKNADGYAGLGLVARERGELRLAEQQLLKALSLGSKRPETLVLLADVLLAQLRNLGDPEAASRSPSWHQARQLLTRALVELPSFGEAHGLLGSTYFYDQEGPEGGIPPMRRALELLPDRADLAYNLVLLHVLAGRFADARKLIETELVPRRRADLMAQALEAVDRGELTEAANQASARGDNDRAVELLRRAAERTHDLELRAAMERQLEGLTDVTRQNHQIERYNLAVEKANAGKIDGAVEELESLLRDLPEGDLAEQVRRLMRELGGAGR